MASYHTRSNSFPSRPHPLVSEVDEQLCRLNASQEASTSSSLISCKLNGLQDLHDCVDQLLLLPLSQQVLSQEKNRKQVDEVLNGSVRILDVCNAAKDALSLMKECTQELQSIIRRRRVGKTDMSSEVRKFLTSKKVVNKAIKKAIKNLKNVGKNDKEEHCATVRMLKEAEAVTVCALESLLSFISGPNAQSKLSSWSLVSKLVNNKRIDCVEDETYGNEFAKVDATLQSLIYQKTRIENVQTQLKHLEQCIEDLEDGLESLFRRLVKTRVSLLNILSN